MKRNDHPTGPRKDGLLARACALSLSEWAGLAIASVALARARIIVARVPGAQIIEGLRSGGSGSGMGDGPADCADWLMQTSWAVQSAAAHLPWRTDCLVRVLAADRLLRRKGLGPEFSLSAGKTDAGDFTAHAWLSCQGIELTGGSNPDLGTLIAPPDALGAQKTDSRT